MALKGLGTLWRNSPLLELVSSFHCKCKRSFSGVARLGSLALSGSAEEEMGIAQEHEPIIAG